MKCAEEGYMRQGHWGRGRGMVQRSRDTEQDSSDVLKLYADDALFLSLQ